MDRKKIKYTNVRSIYIREPRTLDSVLLQSLRDLQIDDKLNEKLLIKFWKDMFGASIINATNTIEYKNRSITIYINSSVIKSELMMLKGPILQKFQEKFGEHYIKYINIF